MYNVLQDEIFELRQAGFRILIVGDFNAHVGNVLGVGIVGNHPGINQNGRRFLRFLEETNSQHLNGACRVNGDWSTRVSEGLWSWNRGGVSTAIDYGVISNLDLNSVKSFIIDDKATFPSGSDHNWIFCTLEDSFNLKLKVPSNKSIRKPKWNFSDGYNWKPFTDCVDGLVSSLGEDISSMDVNDLSTRLSSILLSAAKTAIGFKPLPHQRRLMSTQLPKEIVSAIKLKGNLESLWKSQLSSLSKIEISQRSDEAVKSVNEAERRYVAQTGVVKNLLANRRYKRKYEILKKCSGNSIASRKNFWSYVSPKEKSSTNIEYIRVGNSLVQSPEGITKEVEHHLKKVFLGSSDPILPENEYSISLDHSYAKMGIPTHEEVLEHSYAKSATPTLPVGDGSCDIRVDPKGWMDQPFTLSEVKNAVKKLQNDKAVGFDSIPNEFLKHSGMGFQTLLTSLYNKILDSGQFPKGWNKGRISLIHKRGSRDNLGNYRPLTVIISLSGLYSRVLNGRLAQVVETHKLLGEVQNGFRQGRSCSDNSFILDTILWKSKAKNKKVFLAFFDVSKAYDSVNRSILWQRMSGFGFGGKYLQTLKSIYTGDSIQCEVNGSKTRPIYLKRGLRQGCSLSPLLFNLYISSLGSDLSISNEGVQIGSVVISALLFADDLVVIARTRAGLLKLMQLVKDHADILKLELNTDQNKSEVIAQEGVVGDSWDLINPDGEVVLSLKQVMQYKYLGNLVFPSVSKSAKEKLKLCVSKARQYKGACISLSHEGPDVVDMILATWCNIAIPSILYGCEMIPFSESAIMDIERIQCQIAKYALCLPLTAANVSAQVDLGIKPFRQTLYEFQLNYYNRVLGCSNERWVKQALIDHMSLSWNSPYLEHLYNVRTELGLISLPSGSKLAKHIKDYFVAKTNESLSKLSLPWIRQIKYFKKARHVKEGTSSEYITLFRYNAVSLGHRYPRPGKLHKEKLCPLCHNGEKNTVSHLALFCHVLEGVRRAKTGITSFRNMCSAKNFPNDEIFELFINGYDWNKIQLPLNLYLERGEELLILYEEFIRLS